MQLINRPRLWRDLINENGIKVASYKYNVQNNCFVFFIFYAIGEGAEVYMIC